MMHRQQRNYVLCFIYSALNSSKLYLSVLSKISYRSSQFVFHSNFISLSLLLWSTRSKMLLLIFLIFSFCVLSVTLKWSTACFQLSKHNLNPLHRILSTSSSQLLSIIFKHIKYTLLGRWSCHWVMLNFTIVKILVFQWAMPGVSRHSYSSSCDTAGTKIPISVPKTLEMLLIRPEPMPVNAVYVTLETHCKN